jgi:pantoate--beta-alanine ligase
MSPAVLLIPNPAAPKARPHPQFTGGESAVQTIRDIGQLKSALFALRAGGHRIALVPTMGALHAGHLKLMEEARRQADRVVASIFVNPLQFGANEDLDRYPRREEEDAKALEQVGCDLLWMPTAEQMYPPGFDTKIIAGRVGSRWEGEARPGHFDGVATVVAKLFNAVRPEVAIFGEKDFQQLAVIRRMVIDLNIDVEIVGVATVRDSDGLALSSRNAYLSRDDKSRATMLPRILERTAARISGGSAVEQALEEARQALYDAGFSVVDYVALVDAATLEPIETAGVRMRLIAAATIGGTRLIDNIAVEAQQTR